MQALVALAERRGLHPFLERVVCTERSPLVALDLDPDGSADAIQMKIGESELGMRRWHRCSNASPRAFRDDEKYTIERGNHRAAYADLIARMASAHPKDKALSAFHAFLKGGCTIHPDRRVPGAQYIPYFRGHPVVSSILPDYEDVTADPYGPEARGAERFDVITGIRCRPSARKPIRILGFGSASGTTLISVDDEVTASHWREDPALQVPISEVTMHMHVAALQSLIDETEDGDDGKPRKRWLRAMSRGGEALGYFVWHDRKDGPEAMVLDVLKGRAMLEDVETWAATHRTGNVCVLGLAGSRRLVMHGWSCVPMDEITANVLSYSRRMATRFGRVLGVQQIANLTVPGHLATSFHAARELSNANTDWQSISALVDHIIEGHPFPYLLRERVRMALLSADDIFTTHARSQMTLLENAA